MVSWSYQVYQLRSKYSTWFIICSQKSSNIGYLHQKIVQRKKSEPGLDLFESIYDFNAFISICIYKFRKGRVTGQLRIGGSQLKVKGGEGFVQALCFSCRGRMLTLQDKIDFGIMPWERGILLGKSVLQGGVRMLKSNAGPENLIENSIFGCSKVS